MNFLLVGQAGCYNRGCEAILRTTIEMLNKEFPMAKIVVSSFDYENDRLIDFGGNVSFIPAISNDQWIRFRPQWFCRQFFRIFGKIAKIHP